MTRFLAVFLFLTSSILNVRVRALVPIQQEPAGCLSVETPCTFSTMKSVLHQKEKTSEIDLDEYTLVERRDENEYRFLGGSAIIRAKDSIRWDTLYGTVRAKESEFWIIEKKNKILIRNILGEVHVQIGNQSIEIPEGFEIWIAGKNRKGIGVYGVPSMMKMEKVIIEWARLFEGPKDIFAEKLSNLKILYKQGPNIGGSIYQMVMDRQIASTEEKHRIEDERKRKELSRREQVRRLYFEKVFER